MRGSETGAAGLRWRWSCYHESWVQRAFSPRAGLSAHMYTWDLANLVNRERNLMTQPESMPQPGDMNELLAQAAAEGSGETPRDGQDGQDDAPEDPRPV